MFSHNPAKFIVMKMKYYIVVVVVEVNTGVTGNAGQEL
jgi:hypothetical protein